MRWRGLLYDGLFLFFDGLLGGHSQIKTIVDLETSNLCIYVRVVRVITVYTLVSEAKRKSNVALYFSYCSPHKSGQLSSPIKHPTSPP